jgi:hypothetical protein
MSTPQEAESKWLLEHSNIAMDNTTTGKFRVRQITRQFTLPFSLTEPEKQTRNKEG